MGTRRRGAHRQQHKSKDKLVSTAAGGGVGEAPTSTPPRGSARSSAGLKPSAAEVVIAIESLYADQLKPFGRILRKRIAERAVADGTASVDDASGRNGEGFDNLPDVDIKHLRGVCEACESLHVEPEEGGDWSAVLVGHPQAFVNVYSPYDTYPMELWAEAAVYFEGLLGDEMLLPGGRYSCAQVLMARKLPFLASCSLGQVCHIVQLAISQKKILGYSNGAVVPYSRSQSMVKEQCAVWQQPCANATEQGTPTAPAMPLATWDVARKCLAEILESAAMLDQGPAMIPLSNVKRLFRSRYHIELSETALGHSKLSELLQDERFSDVCMVQLQGHGYIVVQQQRPVLGASPISIANSLPPYTGALDLAFDGSPLTGEPRRLEFCPGEPLCLEDAGLFVEGEPSGPLPLPTPSPSPGLPLGAHRWPAFALSPSTLSKDGRVGSIVQNTFIHAAPTPPPGARRRSHSLPKDVGSDRSPWEAACNSLGFMPRPVEGSGDSTASTADSSAAGGGSTSFQAPLSPAPSSARERLSCEPRSPTPDAAPMKVQLSSCGYTEPLHLLFSEPSPELSDERGSVTPHRIQFCPDEPLSLEDAGVVLDRPPPGLMPVAAPGPRWTALSPSVLSKDGIVGSLVQNTFIHAPPTPLTPAPGASRRARSLPKDVGSDKVAWEATCHALSYMHRPVEACVGGYSAGMPASLAASPSPAFVPPSPAMTASPLPACRSGGGSAPRAPASPGQRVLRLVDLL